jgi:hypothetical protein
MVNEVYSKVTISGVDKTLATTLIMEFWTGKEFVLYSNSYNCLVLRRKKYGSVVNFIKCLVDGSTWAEAPMELTVLCQALPQETILNLNFKLSESISSTNNLESFKSVIDSWVKEFIAFCNQWIENESD